MKKMNNWLEKNKKNILIFGFGIIIGIIGMSFFWPERVAKLENGEEVIVEIDNKSFTANDLYNELKDHGGLDAILNLVDLEILSKKYELTKEDLEEIDKQADSLFEMYETNYGYSKEEFLNANNFKDEETFIKYLKEDFLFQKQYKSYLESLVTEDEASKFYKDTVDGKKEVYVFSASEKDNDLKKVIKSLKKGLSYEEIEKKYPDIICNNIGEVDFTTYSNFSETFLNELKKLSTKEASSVFQEDTFGYTVIYVKKAEKKEKYEDIKKDIISTIGENKANEDESLYYKAFIEMRKKNNIKFYDSSLEKDYSDFMNQYK